MKKFKFKLQAVLKIRQKALEDQQVILAKLFSVLDAQKNVLREMSNSKLELENELAGLLGGNSLYIDEICNYRAFLNQVLNNIKTQEVMILSTNAQIQLQQVEVANAYKACKTIEKLKETQEGAHYRSLEALEMKEIDDIATLRYARAM